MDEWLAETVEQCEVNALDKVIAGEFDQPQRHSAPACRVVVGGVIDGRRDRPTAVVLVVLTSTGYGQQLGVGSAEQARQIISILTQAWPEVRT